MADQENKPAERDWRPIPDPTLLTTRALELAIAQVEEKLFLRTEALKESFAAQLKTLEQQFLDTAVLRNEKFEGVQRQFAERDERVMIAFVTSEKALEKQGQTTSTQINELKSALQRQTDQLSELLRATTSSLDDKITDAKDRLNRIEGATVSKLETKTEQHSSSSFIVALVSVGITILMALLAAAAYLRPGR